MRLLLATAGTRGDVQPMAAFALGLVARGHEVTLAAPPNFERWLAGLGLDVVSMGFDAERFIARIGYDPFKGIGPLRDEIAVQFEAVDGVASEVDVVVGASVFGAGPTLAERHRIPYRYVAFVPSVLPSRAHASPALKWQRLPAWANRASWRMNHLAWNLVFRARLDELRRRVGLGPVESVWPHILGEEVWVASDPALAPVPQDAPMRVVQPGAFVLPESESISAETEAFLAKGAPPVYVGFGSMGDDRPARTTALLVAAIRRAGVRAIVSRGWAGLDPRELPETIHVVGPEPHGKLFPRCAAVVHHGGAGTTSAASRAGVPQLVVPHLLDQFYWAHRVELARIGPPSLPRPRLDAERLASSMRACLDDRLRERARAFATRMIPDGVERAAALVEALAPESRPRAAVR